MICVLHMCSNFVMIVNPLHSPITKASLQSIPVGAASQKTVKKNRRRSGLVGGSYIPKYTGAKILQYDAHTLAAVVFRVGAQRELSTSLDYRSDIWPSIFTHP